VADIVGLTGLRPSKKFAAQIASPPYDVIKEGGSLEHLLKKNPHSFYHIILGNSPAQTIQRFLEEEVLEEDLTPGYYVFEQVFNGSMRTGFYTAVTVDAYSKGNVIRHEKTFDNKVQGRINLANETGYTMGPILLLTNSDIAETLNKFKSENQPLYIFTSNFDTTTDLHGIQNKIWKISESSAPGKDLAVKIGKNPLYIADGHHRYHAALKNKQTHTLAYVVQDAKIQAYNRVIKAKKSFGEIKHNLDLEPIDQFTTPEKHSFHIYTKEGCYKLKAKNITADVVEKLDCSILEKELYTPLGITHDMILDQRYFDYYPETALGEMMAKIDAGEFELAVALHPVSLSELMDVANAGLTNPEVVMPEKSTFFSPKILSGLFLYRHKMN